MSWLLGLICCSVATLPFSGYPGGHVDRCLWWPVPLTAKKSEKAFLKKGWYDWKTFGRKAAQADLELGQLKRLSFGLTASWSTDYRELVKARLGVELVSCGCVVCDAEADYVDGYNEVSEPVIYAWYDREEFARLAKLAREAYEAKIASEAW